MHKGSIGMVIAWGETPNPQEFTFVYSKSDEEFKLLKGMYVYVNSDQGKVMAIVSNVIKTNRYFSSPSAVKAHEATGKSLASIFPSDRWEHIIITAKTLGIFTEDGVERLRYPVAPGEEVFIPDNATLAKFLGLDDENGIYIGDIHEHKLKVKLNLTRLFQKHVALLAISGAGKSYTTSVILEELLNRPPEKGRLAAVLFDVHGEYKGLAESAFKDQVEVFPGAFVQFSTPLLTANQIATFQPDISPVQIRELNRVLRKLRKNKNEQKESYTINDIIDEIERDELINSRSKDALVGWLYTLENTRLFGFKENPNIPEVIKQGKLLIVDLSDFTSLRQKQMIVSYFLQRLFDLRRRGAIAPTTIILEEAHQFAPESGLSMALSKPIIETIAREGRKFYISLFLISQRPVKLSTTALSQCNTHIIMKILNPYDLDFIARSSEGIDRETVNAITSLVVGEAIIVGNAVNYPLFLKIRKRKAKTLETEGLEEIARKYEEI